jgi:riboflavin synthase
MFTGIVIETGRVERIDEIPGGVRLFLDAPGVAAEAVDGASIAIDGCCLTVVAIEGTRLGFDLSPETLRRTVAGDYRSATRVNLEPSLRMSDRMGGHFVTGHVDTVAEVMGLKNEGDFATLTVRLREDAHGLVAEKGSISINGVSLTVAAWRRDRQGGEFDVALIPATLRITNIGEFVPGRRVNIEYDLIARYLREQREGTRP